MKTKTVKRLFKALTPQINNKVDKKVEYMLELKQALEKAKNVPWKTDPCNNTDCWCLGIVPENEILYYDDEPLVIVPQGTVNKELAEHIVKVHNAALIAKERTKEFYQRGK